MLPRQKAGSKQPGLQNACLAIAAWQASAAWSCQGWLCARRRATVKADCGRGAWTARTLGAAGCGAGRDRRRLELPQRRGWQGAVLGCPNRGSRCAGRPWPGARHRCHGAGTGVFWEQTALLAAPFLLLQTVPSHFVPLSCTTSWPVLCARAGCKFGRRGRRVH